MVEGTHLVANSACDAVVILGSEAPTEHKACVTDHGLIAHPPLRVLEFTFRLLQPDEVVVYRENWVDVWTAASNAGGAIDFVSQVHKDDVLPRVDTEIASAVDKGNRVGVLEDPNTKMAMAFAVLKRTSSPLQQHWQFLTRVMVHPACQRRGVGQKLVLEMHRVAKEIGLRQVRLTFRGGTGLERFYEALGYRQIGFHPDGVQIGPLEFCPEITMLFDLYSGA